MRRVPVIVLLPFFAVSRSEDSVDKFVDELIDRAHQAPPAFGVEFDNTTFGKSSHAATPTATNLAVDPIRTSFRSRSFPSAAAPRRDGITRQGHVLGGAMVNPLFSQAQSRRFPIAMTNKEELNAEEATKKYGLEAGLWKAFTNKNDESVKPQDLLKRYGAAYLATSITLAIISYATCYFLISQGVDVTALLGKVGIEATGVATKTGTAAIAYAVHKAASPIRFPPTVALTPIVAGWLGKKEAAADQKEA